MIKQTLDVSANGIGLYCTRGSKKTILVRVLAVEICCISGVVITTLVFDLVFDHDWKIKLMVQINSKMGFIGVYAPNYYSDWTFY